MCSERGPQVIMSETDGVGASKFKTNAELRIIEKDRVGGKKRLYCQSKARSDFGSQG